MHSIVGNAPAIFCLGTRLDFVFVISLLGSSLYRVTGSGDTVTRMPYFRPPPFDKTSCSAAVAGCTPVVRDGSLPVVKVNVAIDAALWFLHRAQGWKSGSGSSIVGD